MGYDLSQARGAAMSDQLTHHRSCDSATLPRGCDRVAQLRYARRRGTLPASVAYERPVVVEDKVQAPLAPPGAACYVDQERADLREASPDPSVCERSIAACAGQHQTTQREQVPGPVEASRDEGRGRALQGARRRAERDQDLGRPHCYASLHQDRAGAHSCGGLTVGHGRADGLPNSPTTCYSGTPPRRYPR